MRPPEFITFTGVDANTPIRELVALSQRYPIEWGVLFSPSRHDDPRYPSTSYVFELIAQARSHRLRLAAHLCGNHSRNIFDLGGTSIDGLMTGFQRAQVNSPGRAQQGQQRPVVGSQMGREAHHAVS
jgi:hypothetical protein